MSAELFHKIVLYTTPFHEMEEIPVTTPYVQLLKELKKDLDDLEVCKFNSNKPKGAERLYTVKEVLESKRATTYCEICEKEFKTQREKHGDHSHKTGEWRGVLCGTCNAGLGMFKDSPELCEAAAAYLRRKI